MNKTETSVATSAEEEFDRDIENPPKRRSTAKDAEHPRFPNLHAKLGYIQSHLHCAKDNAVKNFSGRVQYTYRNLAAICEAVKPLLAETRCVLTITNEVVLIGAEIAPVFKTETGKDGAPGASYMAIGPHYYLKATATITDCETGGWISVSDYAREAEYRKGMDPSQQTGSTSSYAGKYALERLFLLDSTKDADAIAAENNPF